MWTERRDSNDFDINLQLLSTRYLTIAMSTPKAMPFFEMKNFTFILIFAVLLIKVINK